MARISITIAKGKPQGKKPAPMLNTRALFADLRRQLEPNLKAKLGPDIELFLSIGEVGSVKVQGLLAKDGRKIAEQILAELMADFDLGEYVLEASA